MKWVLALRLNRSKVWSIKNPALINQQNFSIDYIFYCMVIFSARLVWRPNRARVMYHNTYINKTVCSEILKVFFFNQTLYSRSKSIYVHTTTKFSLRNRPTVNWNHSHSNAVSNWLLALIALLRWSRFSKGHKFVL